MSPVYIVIALAIGLRLGGGLGLLAIHSTQEAVRWATGLSFMLMGAAHFTPIGHDVRRLVPPWLGRPALVVALLGVWQLAGGIGLVTPPPGLRRVAAGALVLLLLLKLPANVRVAREKLSLKGRYATHPSWRVPAQFLWITLVCWSAL